MNKELTPLEALDDLCKLANASDIKFQYELNTFTRQAKVNELKPIIENSLKDYKKNKLFINEILDMLSNDNNINNVLNDIKNSDSYEDFATIYSSCPKEKYDLLRGILL